MAEKRHNENSDPGLAVPDLPRSANQFPVKRITADWRPKLGQAYVANMAHMHQINHAGI